MGKHKTAVLVGLLIVVVVVAGVFYYFHMRSQTGEVGESPLVQESIPEGETPESEESVEPIDVDLNASDALVREMVGLLSSHPQLARWLVTDHLIRRFVAVVDLIALGDSPRRPMDFIEVDAPFQVRESEEGTFIDPDGYERYNAIAETVSSLDAEGCAKLYRQLRLPVQEAYREMGYPDEDFDEALSQAIIEILETPVVEGRIYVEKDVVTYLLMDPELENLRPAQKHLLRMGPDNIRLVQSKLREIAQYMGIAVPEETLFD